MRVAFNKRGELTYLAQSMHQEGRKHKDAVAIVSMFLLLSSW